MLHVKPEKHDFDISKMPTAVDAVVFHGTKTNDALLSGFPDSSRSDLSGISSGMSFLSPASLHF